MRYTFNLQNLKAFPNPESFIPTEFLPLADDITAVKLAAKGEALKARAFISLVSAVEFNRAKEILDEAVYEWRLGETYLETVALYSRKEK